MGKDLQGPDCSRRPASPRVWVLGVLVFACELGLASASAWAQSQISLDAAPQVFAVLCAARAAGMRPQMSSDRNPVGARVDGFLAQLDPARVAPLEDFLRRQPRIEGPQTIHDLLSLGLVLDPPPQLEFVLAQRDLPPGAYEWEGFVPLVRDLYAQAGLGRLWEELAPAYQQAVAERRLEAVTTLQETRGYLRLASESYPGRTYTIYLEWLVPEDAVSARNYGEHYFLVLNPRHADFSPAVRHQYLHYLLDPIAIKYARELRPWRRLQLLAAQAPLLPEAFRDDLLLLVTESLIQAMEVRMRRLPPAEELGEVDRIEREGYLFVRHFVNRLVVFEQAEPSIRFFFPELLRGLDPDREEARLRRLPFASSPPPAGTAHRERATRGGNELREGEERLRREDYEGARERFERHLRETNPKEPRALYGLALVASHGEDREQAKHYFLRVLEVALEPRLLGWTHIYLGRIYDLEGDREQALSHYRAALAVGASQEKIQEAARRGLERAFGMEEPEAEQQPQ